MSLCKTLLNNNLQHFLEISRFWTNNPHEHFNEPGGELFCTRLKNSISNTIRLDDKRKNLLKKYIRESPARNGDPLFVSRRGNPISSRQLDRLTQVRQLFFKYIVISKSYIILTLFFLTTFFVFYQGHPDFYFF